MKEIKEQMLEAYRAYKTNPTDRNEGLLLNLAISWGKLQD